MTTDPHQAFKAAQRESWALFAPVEVWTTPLAAHLVNYAKIEAGERVLDVGCGTGVVAITAALRGAHVEGVDLSPVLLEKARLNAQIAEVKVDFVEGDVENLPHEEGEFDVVLSQFGHMFAPRPERAVAEMLRVLKPGGKIAFSTWPPEHFTGRMFALTARYLAPPPGVVPPTLWGEVKVIRERLGEWVRDLSHEREILSSPSLSPQHFRTFLEATIGPLRTLLQNLKGDSEKLNAFRSEFDALVSEFFEKNTVRQHYLLTRAWKR